jgi:CHAT domain-containing protein
VCGVDEFGDRAAPLAYTRREVTALERIAEGEARVWWKEGATRRKLLAWNERGQLQEFALLHFATHARIEPQTPHWSRILLADEDLTVLDIMALRLRARLVTLSACSSALGEIGRGDELIGLARAFFYAGARALVASLWAVEDESTVALMTQFYQNLRAGNSIADALRAAQRAMIRAGGEPFQWAPFVAVGNV